MKTIAELEKRIQYLELENQRLKNLLADAGIPYFEEEIEGSAINMIGTRALELYQETLQKRMQMCSLVCFGDAQMYTASVP